MTSSKRIAATLTIAAGILQASLPQAQANGYPTGLIGLGLVGPYGSAQDAYVDAYFDLSWGKRRSTWGYDDREGYYRRAPVYGTTYAAPSYVDEDCRIHIEPTAYGWRRYRVCQ